MLVRTGFSKRPGCPTDWNCYVCMYVDLHIGRIRMDIDNPGVTWDLDKTCKASNVSML
jgi:hypothetical protein